MRSLRSGRSGFPAAPPHHCSWLGSESPAGSPTSLCQLGSGSLGSFLVGFMAALAQPLKLPPGISAMWTPPELLCTPHETNFKDALLPVFKRKLLLPAERKHPLASPHPSFPFPLPHHSLSSPLTCSCPFSLSAFSLASPAWWVPPFPHISATAGGSSREAGCTGEVSSPRSPAEGHPAIAAGLCPAPAPGPGGRGAWGSQAGCCVCNAEQTFKLKGTSRTKLLSQESQFSLFLLQIS